MEFRGKLCVCVGQPWKFFFKVLFRRQILDSLWDPPSFYPEVFCETNARDPEIATDPKRRRSCPATHTFNLILRIFLLFSSSYYCCFALFCCLYGTCSSRHLYKQANQFGCVAEKSWRIPRVRNPARFSNSQCFFVCFFHHFFWA